MRILLIGLLLCLQARADVQNCTNLFAQPLSYLAVWDGEGQGEFTEIKELNGLILWEVTQFFTRHKKLPTELELLKKLRASHKSAGPESLLQQTLNEGLRFYFAQPGAAGDLIVILRQAQAALPAQFADLQQTAAGHLSKYFAQRLRLPTLAQLASEMKMDPLDLDLVIGSRAELWATAQRARPELILEARAKLFKAFQRATSQTDRPEHLRTQRSTPTAEDVYRALTRIAQYKKLQGDIFTGEFTEAHFMRLLGGAEELSGDFIQPALFPEGLSQLIDEARKQHPASFRNYSDQTQFDLNNASDLVAQLTEKSGFLATSVVAGIPLEENQFKLMLQYAEDTDRPVLVFPVNGVTEGLDERLLKHPRIHIVSHTVENPFLKIWNLPIMAKNQNALASLDQRGQFIPGQLVIVGHTQLTHRLVSTGEDYFLETAQWSTGSLSQNLYPFRNPIQGRTSGLAKNYHTNSFLVVEKADAQAGTLAKGATNMWHVRPVYFTDDLQRTGRAGFIDFGRSYSVDESGGIRVEAIDPIALAMGDLHDVIALQAMMKVYREVFERFPLLYEAFIHDPRDGGSHNHHESNKPNLLAKKFARGELDIHKEDMGLVQTTNALLSINPRLRLIYIDSNHSYWLKNLLENPLPSQRERNGPYITELQHAASIMGIDDPLTYVMNHRNDYIQSLPPHVRKRIEMSSILVSEPNRVQVLPYGRTYAIGPEHRPVHMNFHGHQGDDGSRGSPRSHAKANQNSITGDSHTSAILGGWINVGSSTPKRMGYNDGGYSKWNNSFALVYADGSKQLITYQNLIRSYRQRPENGILPGASFFGEHPLQVLPNDNDRLPLHEVMDSHSWWIRSQKERLKGE